MKSFLHTLLLLVVMGLLSSILSPQSWATFTWFYDPSDWEANVTSAGLGIASRGWDTIPHGGICDFSVGTVQFDNALVFIDGFSVGSEWGNGALAGSPLYGIGISMSTGVTKDVQFVDEDRYTEAGQYNMQSFVGVISTVPLESVQYHSLWAGGEFYNVHVATTASPDPIPEPGTLALFLGGISASGLLASHHRRRRKTGV